MRKLSFTIRSFKADDLEECLALFYDTVHTVNAKDYNAILLDDWAPKLVSSERRAKWLREFTERICYVAVYQQMIVGFTDLNYDGYLDRLFAHKDYQGQGIGSALCQQLLSEAKSKQIGLITTEASITAKPFFEALGFAVDKKQETLIKGHVSVNYRMTIKLSNS